MSTNVRSAYLQGIGQDASPVRLIILLHEQLIQDLRLAVAAIDGSDIEGRTSHLSHALQVLGELDAALNMEGGQEVARNLTRFYGLLRSGLFQVQVHPDRRVLEKHVASLLSLREAWMEVERQTTNGPQSRTEVQGSSQSAVPQASGANWRG